MALSTPTIKEIQANIVADIEAEYSQTVPVLARAVFRVWAFIQAGVFVVLYKFGSTAYRNGFVNSADDFSLDLKGEQVGIIRKQALSWIGEGTGLVTPAGSGVIQGGTQLVNNATGVIYIVTASVEIAPASITIGLAATESGEITNLNNGQSITFVSPQPGVDESVEIINTIQQGDDKETTVAYRERVQSRYQKQPQGGALADYESWGLDTPNFIFIRPYAGTTPGTVDVFGEVDNQTDGIPTGEQLQDLAEKLEFSVITGRPDRQPVTATVSVFPISRTTFAVTIEGLSPDNPDIREAIEAAVEDFFLDKEPFIIGLDTVRIDTITKAGVIAVAQVVAAANGSTINDGLVLEQGTPFDLRTLTQGEKAKVSTPFNYI